MKSKLTDPAFGIRSKFYRLFFSVAWALAGRFSPVPLFRFRVFLLRLFGADVSGSFRIYPSASVWSPMNLQTGLDSTVGPRVKLYNQGMVILGKRVIVSQDATICASTHDYNNPLHPLVLSPITIHDDAWICAEAFIGPGVTVGEGAVIGARAVLTKDAEPWSIYAGNPAIKIKDRKRFVNE
ncbi:MAG: putative colanic acid biosynthesis acetyltransferase [Candidatus Poseidoniia archaeon]|jgi:putative colanic acid biosynthesis acetyltransferase WcaF|nr:putative colanic acid biosynthesis acetyltransferase [Candidatus Poseidoniia archaeon]